MNDKDSDTNDSSRKFYERLTRVETELKNLKDDFENFCNNHFNSFKREIRKDIQDIKDTLNKRPTWIFTGTMAGLLSITTALIVYLLTK